MVRVLQSLIGCITPLNLLLASALFMAGVNIVPPFSRENYRLKLPSITPREAVQGPKPVEVANAPLPTDYAVIGEMNLFHPERIIPIDKKSELPKPELILFGTIIDGGEKIAFVEDKKSPTTSPGRGKRQSVIRKGSIIGGFTVTEIASGQIVLVRGDERMTVELTEGEKRKDRNIIPQTVSSPVQPVPSPSVSPRSPKTLRSSRSAADTANPERQRPVPQTSSFPRGGK